MLVKKEQSGFTLIEVIAGIVITTIILLSFLLIFINATKTTKTSNEIFDATYYAQKEMEHIYQLSQAIAFSNREQAIMYIPALPDETTEQYEAKKVYYYSKIDNSHNFEKIGNAEEDAANHYYYELTCQALPLNLTKVIIKVYEQKGGILKAQMESTYEWR